MSKPRGKPFEPGNTLGQGRPKGSRNKPKSPGQALFDEYAPPLTRKCIALGLQGDRSALRMCMERVSPARRGACISMNLPAIRTAGDVDKAAEKVTQALRRGDITPTEGGVLMNTLESRSRIMGRVLPEEPIAANQIELRDPELAALTDDELAQLLAITTKMEAARSSAGRDHAPPVPPD
ncbi:MAG TPA: hypothetical protein VN841_30810 [Bryobacteraceae bacterium]|nr:hypothetical protein [Bryobacteraceae bacterium]